ncbi:MAG TPA: FAD:protein FMN transferase [bacterium]|nr:FAD:protein FMN transferase [bacterium]
MDTFVRICVYERFQPEEEIRRIVDEAFHAMEYWEIRTSCYADTGLVSRINQQAGGSVLPADSMFRYLLTRSLEIGRDTKGAFDVTVGRIKQLWDFNAEKPRVPDELELKEALRHVDWQGVDLTKQGVRLAREGMSIDLGGIAKGFIIDRAVEVLQNAGLSAGIVDAGGDLRVFGRIPGRNRWRIGIRHPRKDGAILGVIQCLESSIATSGDYERFFLIDGIRYHHLLDPKTGYPAWRCVSATVVAATALEADAYATAAFIMGYHEGKTWFESRSGLEALWIVEKNGELSWEMTSGMETILKIE